MDRLNLWYQMNSTIGEPLYMALDAFEDLQPTLFTYETLGEDLCSVAEVDVTAEMLEDFANTLQEWAQKLRAHQQQLYQNNLFEEEQ